ncbi:TIGR03086 family metal-binding protein [Streptomyces sp. BpilaLS-43]|uniref:TIGR03086 family metal-binding protein n=1 Tax=Streptomyces sp. BpilaLS-43 TaxID=1839778 RepID=UPI000AF64824|nr:TIGR03086 family metal-binding protein [Streptomyces sp. BpilaLS-43]
MRNAYAHMTECAAECARVARAAGTPLAPSAPTPCGDWDLRQLVNHWVLYTAYGLEHRALRTPIPDELTARDFTAGPDWAGSYARRLDRAVAAWSDPAVWEGDIDTGHGSSPAREIAGMLTVEAALHGWDVATATGGEFRLSDPAAAYVLEIVEASAALYRKYEGFAAEVPPPPGGSAFGRALALSGRDPRRAAV